MMQKAKNDVTKRTRGGCVVQSVFSLYVLTGIFEKCYTLQQCKKNKTQEFCSIRKGLIEIFCTSSYCDHLGPVRLHVRACARTRTHRVYLLSSQVFKNTDRLVHLPSLHVTWPLFPALCR